MLAAKDSAGCAPNRPARRAAKCDGIRDVSRPSASAWRPQTAERRIATACATFLATRRGLGAHATTGGGGGRSPYPWGVRLVDAIALPLALTYGDGILIIVAIAIPLAALSFLGAGRAFSQIGKGQFAIEQEIPQKRGSQPAPIPAEVREAEIRQLLEAKSYRQESRGGAPLDVDAELARILASESQPAGALRGDAQLVAEVRELVVARNERRQRQGREPLDVDAEVERQLRELESLGQ